MNKIYMTKRGHDGKTVVCSEKTRARGKVKSLVLAVAAVGTLVSTQASAALTTGESGAYATVIKDATISGSGGDGAVGTVTIGSDLQYVDAYGRQAKTEASAPLSIAIGLGATAKKVDGTPSDSTNPTDPNFDQPLASIAIGASSTANGYTSTAIGYRSSAIDRSAVAFGAQANAENFMATALGSGATSTGFTSTSVGANAEATGRNSVSVGTSRHTDGLVASGEQGILLGASDIEGLTAEQLQGVRYADGANPWSSFDGSNLSEPAKATGESRTAIVSGKNALGVGVAVKATGERAIAEGYYASASGTDSVALGSNANATKTNAMALGTSTVVTAENSTALGGLNAITTANTFAFGSNITTSIGKDVILGTDSASYLAGAQTSGRDTYTSYEIDGTTYNFAGVTPNNVISVGAIGKEGRIQNVAAGLISETSTDAINGSQLFAVTQSLEELAAKPDLDTNTDKSVRVSSTSPLLTISNATGAADGITTMTDYSISLSDQVATKTFVTEEIAKIDIPVDTDKSVRVNGSDLVTVTNTTGAKDGITDMTDYTITLSDKVATKDFVADEIAKIPTVTDTNTISEVERGDGITVNAVTEGDKTTYTVALDDATKAQLAKEESVVAKAGQTNIKVTQPRTNGTGGNEFEVDLASDLTNINSIANGDTKLSLGDAQVNVNGATITNVASPVNATDAVNKQYVDDSKPTVSEGYGIAVTETLTTKGAATSIDYNVALNEKTKQTLVQVAVNTGNINKGINTKAEDGKVINHQLGDTISVVGDSKNITTATTEDGAISVKMADDIKVNSVSINNTGITMGGNGIHAGDMKVTGVAPGTLSPSSTDAVNGSQLYATNMQVAQNAQDIRNLGDQLGDMRDEYRAGIADAAAVAGLPEIHLAGKSMFALAGSTFKGESALAVGYSRLSDNSMMKFKASGSVNTQGDVLGTVGVGWAW